MSRLGRGLVRIFLDGSIMPIGGQCIHITIYSRSRRLKIGGGALLGGPDPSDNRREFARLFRQARSEWRRSILGNGWQERKALARWYPAIDAEPLRVAHASLKPWSEDSAFKAHCPSCNTGLLMVARDQRTLRISREDRCISCAQRFVYTDNEIGGEALPKDDA
jgi:hypothetical protein